MLKTVTGALFVSIVVAQNNNQIDDLTVFDTPSDSGNGVVLVTEIVRKKPKKEKYKSWWNERRDNFVNKGKNWWNKKVKSKKWYKKTQKKLKKIQKKLFGKKARLRIHKVVDRTLNIIHLISINNRLEKPLFE